MERLSKQFSLNGNRRWIFILPQVIHDYNNSFHRTIKAKPCEIWGVEKEKELLRTVYNFDKKIIRETKFNLGDFVRICKYKATFEKSYNQNYSTEIFKIIGVNHLFPVRYYLEDASGEKIKGGFYDQELTKANISHFFFIVFF